MDSTDGHDQIGLEAEVAQLREAMAYRAAIEQAKGIIVVMRACSPERAFGEIRQVSMDNNVKLHDLCGVLVAVAGREDVAAVAPGVRQVVLNAWASDLAKMQAMLGHGDNLDG